MRIVEYPAIPYKTSIHNGFNQGATIEVHGTPLQGRGQSFTINLRSREGIALHFNVRMGAFGEHVVVLNNEKYTKWQSEQRIQNPFRFGQKFKLQLINMTNSFTFYLNGSPLTHFHHRESPHNITSFEISGDVNVERLVLDKFSENYKTPQVDVHTDVLSVSLAQTHITSTIPGQPYPAGTVYRESNPRAPYSNRPPNTQPASYNPYQGQNTPYTQPPPTQPTYNPYRDQGPQPSYQAQYQQQNSYGASAAYQTEPTMMVRPASPTRVYVQEQTQDRMVIEHQYPIQREASQTNVYVQQQNQGNTVTVQSEGSTSVYYEQEAQSRMYPSNQMRPPPPIGVAMPQAPSVYMTPSQPPQHFDQQPSWAYNRPQNQAQVVIEQTVPPPVYVRQAAPPPVVIRQRAPSPVIIERQAPTTMVYTERPPSPTRIVVTTQKPCKTAIVAEGVHSLVDAIAEAVQNNKKRCN